MASRYAAILALSARRRLTQSDVAQALSGKLAEISVWSSPLDAATIRSYARADFNPSSVPYPTTLAALFTLQPDGTLADATGNYPNAQVGTTLSCFILRMSLTFARVGI